MNVDKMAKEAIQEKQLFMSIPKDNCEVIIHNFNKPIKKINYHGTEYVIYDCTFIKIEQERIAFGRHRIQLSFKTAWLQLYAFLKDLNKLKEKNIHVWVVKKHNYHYVYSLKKEE